MWSIAFIYLHMLNHPSISDMNYIFFVVNDHFGMFLDLVDKHFIETFYIYVHKELGL